jgi:hypothetical protein
MFFASTASAHGCPGEMRTIDAKLPTATLPAAEMSKVKAFKGRKDPFSLLIVHVNGESSVYQKYDALVNSAPTSKTKT